MARHVQSHHGNTSSRGGVWLSTSLLTPDYPKQYTGHIKTELRLRQGLRQSVWRVLALPKHCPH